MENRENLREIERVIAAVVVISADHRILMGRQRQGGTYPGVWHIPGGGVEAGETLEQAARREVNEETGLDLAGVELHQMPQVGLGETDKTLKTGERVWVKMTFHRFEARLKEPAAEVKLHPGDDLVELRWFGSRELSEAEQIPGGREFFEAAGYLRPLEKTDYFDEAE